MWWSKNGLYLATRWMFGLVVVAEIYTWTSHLIIEPRCEWISVYFLFLFGWFNCTCGRIMGWMGMTIENHMSIIIRQIFWVNQHNTSCFPSDPEHIRDFQWRESRKSEVTHRPCVLLNWSYGSSLQGKVNRQGCLPRDTRCEEKLTMPSPGLHHPHIWMLTLLLGQLQHSFEDSKITSQHCWAFSNWAPSGLLSFSHHLVTCSEAVATVLMIPSQLIISCFSQISVIFIKACYHVSPNFQCSNHQHSCVRF